MYRKHIFFKKSILEKRKNKIETRIDIFLRVCYNLFSIKERGIFMINKKTILIIVMFVVTGFLVFSFANPNDDNELNDNSIGTNNNTNNSKDDENKDNDKKDNQTSNKDKNDTKTEEENK